MTTDADTPPTRLQTRLPMKLLFSKEQVEGTNERRRRLIVILEDDDDDDDDE